MKVSSIILSAVCLYGFLIFIGAAALSASRKKINCNDVLFLGPVIGLSLISIFITYTLLCGFSINEIAIQFGLLMFLVAGISLTTCTKFYKKNNFRITGKTLSKLLIIVFTICILFTPLMIGSHQFSILRGNGTDEFNYVNMANYLINYGLNGISSSNNLNYELLSPTKLMAEELLKTRWTTSAVLGLSAKFFGVSPLEFEYSYSVVLMLVIFGSLNFAFSPRVGSSIIYYLISSSFIVGFWGQFLLDIRSLSHISGLPILICLWAIFASNSTYLKSPFLISLMASALLMQYPELFSVFLPVILLFGINNYLIDKKFIYSALKIIIFSTIIILPIWKFLLSFALSQLLSVKVVQVGWDYAYFSWLNKPILGIFGLGAIPNLGGPIDFLYSLTANTLAYGLLVILIIRCVYFIGSYRPVNNIYIVNLDSAILLSLIVFLLQAIPIYTSNNLWALGKLVSYYSFLIPLWLGYIWCANKTGESRMGLAAKYFILAWVFMGFILAFARVIHSSNNSDLKNYIYGHGEYRRVHAENIPYLNPDMCPKGKTVAVFSASEWEREMLTYWAEGNGYKVILPGYRKIRSNAVLQDSINNDKYECLLANAADIRNIDGVKSNGYYFGSVPNAFSLLAGLSGGYGWEEPDKRSKVLSNGGMVTYYFYAKNIDSKIKLRICIQRNVLYGVPIYMRVDDGEIKTIDVSNCEEVLVDIIASNLNQFHKIDLWASKLLFSDSIRESNADSRPLLFEANIVNFSSH